MGFDSCLKQAQILTVAHKFLQNEQISPCYLSALIRYYYLPNRLHCSWSSCCSLNIVGTSESWHMAFSLPGKFFLQIATWLAPSPLSDLCPNMIFSMRASLTILLKIVRPSLHYSTPLYFLNNICTMRYTAQFLFVCLFLPQDCHLDRGRVFRLFCTSIA